MNGMSKVNEPRFGFKSNLFRQTCVSIRIDQHVRARVLWSSLCFSVYFKLHCILIIFLNLETLKRYRYFTAVIDIISDKFSWAQEFECSIKFHYNCSHLGSYGIPRVPAVRFNLQAACSRRCKVSFSRFRARAWGLYAVKSFVALFRV